MNAHSGIIFNSMHSSIEPPPESLFLSVWNIGFYYKHRTRVHVSCVYAYTSAVRRARGGKNGRVSVRVLPLLFALINDRRPRHGEQWRRRRRTFPPDTYGGATRPSKPSSLLPPPFFSFNFVSTPITISFGRLCLSQDVHSNLSSFRGQEISHFLPYSSRRRENQTLVGVVTFCIFFFFLPIE